LLIDFLTPEVKILARPPAHRAYGPEGEPGYGFPQRGCALLKFHWLIETPNIKFQSANKKKMNVEHRTLNIELRMR
jgi:hypothetical protein